MNPEVVQVSEKSKCWTKFENVDGSSPRNPSPVQGRGEIHDVGEKRKKKK